VVGLLAVAPGHAARPGGPRRRVSAGAAQRDPMEGGWPAAVVVCSSRSCANLAPIRSSFGGESPGRSGPPACQAVLRPSGAKQADDGHGARAVGPPLSCAVNPAGRFGGGMEGVPFLPGGEAPGRPPDADVAPRHAPIGPLSYTGAGRAPSRPRRCRVRSGPRSPPSQRPARGDVPPPTAITLCVGTPAPRRGIRRDIPGAAWNQLRVVSPWANASARAPRPPAPLHLAIMPVSTGQSQPLHVPC